MINLPSWVWVLSVLIIGLMTWLVFYYLPVVMKTTVSFVFFSAIILIVSVWFGTKSMEKFVREWSEYEVSRIKEGAFTFLERRKSDHRTIVRRFLDEPEKIMEDKFVKTIVDYIAIVGEDGKIQVSNRNFDFIPPRIEEDFKQFFIPLNDGVYLITLGKSAVGKLIIIGEKADIRLLPALQGMLSINDIYISKGEKGKSEDLLKNAEVDLGGGIRLVMVPNYDLIFQLISNLVSDTSMSLGVSLALAVIFFAFLSLVYIRKPLMALISASTEVEKGNFEYEIQQRPKGDVGKLINTFNGMIRGLRRRDAQIKYRNELLSAIKELARSILNEFDKEKIFGICVDVSAIKTGSKCAIFYSNKVRYSEPVDLNNDEVSSIPDEEIIKKNGNYIISYEISAQKEEGKIIYGRFVAQRDRDFLQEEKEFFMSIVNYAASACLRSDYVMKLKLLQSTDAITGLFNSTFFKSSVKREASMLKRFQRDFSIVFIDVENSSEIIDRFGNIIWEDIIKAIAMIMKKSVRTYDIPARLGNDRFALLLPNTTSQNAKVVEARVRDIIASAPEIPSLPELEMKVNVFSVSTDISSVDEIFKRLDERITSVQDKPI